MRIAIVDNIASEQNLAKAARIAFGDFLFGRRDGK